MRLRAIAAVVAAVAAVGLTKPAAAQSGSNEWQFALAPYPWASGMDGTLGIADLETAFGAPFSTIGDNLDIDYEDGEDLHFVGLDVMMSGPQLGVVFSF